MNTIESPTTARLEDFNFDQFSFGETPTDHLFLAEYKNGNRKLQPFQLNKSNYNHIFVYCLSRFPAYAAISGGLTGGVVYVFVSILTFVTINIFPAKHMFNLGLSNLILTIASLITISYLVQPQRRFSFNKT